MAYSSVGLLFYLQRKWRIKQRFYVSNWWLIKVESRFAAVRLSPTSARVLGLASLHAVLCLAISDRVLAKCQGEIRNWAAVKRLPEERIADRTIRHFTRVGCRAMSDWECNQNYTLLRTFTTSYRHQAEQANRLISSPVKCETQVIWLELWLTTVSGWYIQYSANPPPSFTAIKLVSCNLCGGLEALVSIVHSIYNYKMFPPEALSWVRYRHLITNEWLKPSYIEQSGVIDGRADDQRDCRLKVVPVDSHFAILSSAICRI